MIENMTSSLLGSLYQETVELKAEYFAEAARVASPLTSRAQRSKVRLHMLALKGFESWLSSQATALPFAVSECSLYSPAIANVVSAACHVKLGEFKICLIATQDIAQEVVSVPRAVVELGEFSAHFYILMQIVEEEGVMVFRGMMRQDHLANYLQQTSQLKTLPNWTYLMPLSLFDTRINRLPLSAAYLDPMSLEQHACVPQNALTNSASIPSFTEVWTYLQAADTPVWKSMSWEKGAAILRSPQLLALMLQYQQRPDLRLTLKEQTERLLQTLRRPVANATLWLQRGLDDFSRSLGFCEQEKTLIPQQMPMCTTPFERCQNIVNLLRENELPVPTEIRVISYSMAVQQRHFMFCIIPIEPVSERPSSQLNSADVSWRFLAIVIPNDPGDKLPIGTQLSIRSQNTILAEPSLQLETSFLYAMVDGSNDAPIEASVTLMGESSHTVPAFNFSGKQL